MPTNIRGVGARTGAVMLILTGAAFVLERFTDVAGVWRWLPLLAVYLGARELWRPMPGARRTTVPLLIGIWLLVCTIRFFDFDFLNGWPLLVVLVGLGLVIDGLIEGDGAARQEQMSGRGQG